MDTGRLVETREKMKTQRKLRTCQLTMTTEATVEQRKMCVQAGCSGWNDAYAPVLGVKPAEPANLFLDFAI